MTPFRTKEKYQLADFISWYWPICCPILADRKAFYRLQFQCIDFILDNQSLLLIWTNPASIICLCNECLTFELTLQKMCVSQPIYWYQNSLLPNVSISSKKHVPVGLAIKKTAVRMKVKRLVAVEMIHHLVWSRWCELVDIHYFNTISLLLDRVTFQIWLWRLITTMMEGHLICIVFAGSGCAESPTETYIVS